MKSLTITSPLIIAATLLALAPLRAQDQSIINAAATSALPQAAPARVQIQQWRGQYGGAAKNHTDVFTTQKAWVEFWKPLGQKPPGAIDEKTEMAVFISVGERATGGFKPYIVSAVEQNGKMVVSYSSGQPILTDIVMQEVTHPWVAAVIPKSALPVVFKEM
jgi:hypothetical protein